MSLTRLKRQDFHTYICGLALVCIQALACYLTDRTLRQSGLFFLLWLAGSLAAGAFLIVIRKAAELFCRQLAVSLLCLGVMILSGRAFQTALQLFLAVNLVYLIWLLAAGMWIRRELCPGWTLLVYDNQENLKRAKQIAAAQKDLITDVYHLQYDKDQAAREEMERIIHAFRIPQMVLCLENDSPELLNYCKEEGIAAFVEEAGEKASAAGSLRYIRPVPTLFGRSSYQIKNGAIHT